MWPWLVLSSDKWLFWNDEEWLCFVVRERSWPTVWKQLKWSYPGEGSIHLGNVFSAGPFPPTRFTGQGTITLRTRYVVLKSWIDEVTANVTVSCDLVWAENYQLDGQNASSGDIFSKRESVTQWAGVSWHTFTKTKEKMYPEKQQILLYWVYFKNV